MKKCNHCNAENLDNARFCDSCGIKLEEFEPIIFEKEVIVNDIAEETNSFNEVQNDEQTDNEQPSFTETPPTPIILSPYLNQRKHGGVMAFSVINICSILFSVFTLYMSFFSMIFGIIAIVTLNKAKNEPNDDYYKIRKRNALILNIVGLVLGLLGFIAFIGLVVFIIVTNFQGIGSSVL